MLGASSFLYAEATWTQALGDWIEAHNGVLTAIGGVPALLVPDNTKVAVIRACLYDPVVNCTYTDMAAHYDTAILPARPYKLRDKAKVEVGVLIAERRLLGRLRHTKFYSLAELNTAIAEFCRRLNDDRIIRRVGQTRRALIEIVNRPALKSLPAEPYGLAEWRIRRVGIDYHVEVDNHSYNVPHRYARAEVDARLTARTVEVFLRGERIATHLRGSGGGKYTTLPDHMPSSYCRYADWTIELIGREADAIGLSVGILCTLILERRPNPEQGGGRQGFASVARGRPTGGVRACLGILRLARSVPTRRLDVAAARAIKIGALIYGSVKSILDSKLDQVAAEPRSAEHQSLRHRNIRSGGYFH